MVVMAINSGEVMGVDGMRETDLPEGERLPDSLFPGLVGVTRRLSFEVIFGVPFKGYGLGRESEKNHLVSNL